MKNEERGASSQVTQTGTDYHKMICANLICAICINLCQSVLICVISVETLLI